MLIKGQEFLEVAGTRSSPTYRYATENAQVQRTLWIRDPAVVDVEPWATALLGYAVVRTDQGGPGGATRRWIERTTPAAYPSRPTPDNPAGNPYLYCTSIPSADPASAPKGVDAGGRSAYTWYRLSTVWETLSYDVKEDSDVIASAGELAGKPDEGDALRRGWANTRYVTRNVEHGAQVVTLRNLMRWANPVDVPIPPDNNVKQGLATQEAWAYPVARLVYDYVWHAVPIEGVPFNTIQKTLNRVSTEQFDGLPGICMLFTDAKIRAYRSAFGQRIADVAYRFAYRPNFDVTDGKYYGFHAGLRVLNGVVRWYRMSTDGWAPAGGVVIDDDKAPFRSASFAPLFHPDQG